MDKKLIAERFNKAATTYTQEASVQHQIANHMLQRLKEHLHQAPKRIVEFGCGTGNYSRMIINQFHPKELLLNDLCENMMGCCADLLSEEVSFITDDAEYLQFPPERDLITSCSTLQWFDNPEVFFHRCSGYLQPEGYLAFTTFGLKNMQEIRATTGQGLSYLSISELCQSLLANYEIIHASEEVIEQYFDDPKQVLRHLKATGVTGISNPHWTPRTLIRFCEQYGKLYTAPQGVRLTYHPIYIIAKKKNNEK